MKDFKGTKGKWKEVSHNNKVTIFRDSDEICFMACHSYAEEEHQANAQLISAAPNMLKELTYEIEFLEGLLNDTTNKLPFAVQSTIRGRIVVITELLDKALGK